jgi:predicted DNA-binding transcriptional regulator AlpA
MKSDTTSSSSAAVIADLKVLTIAEVVEATGLSYAVLRRLELAGEGPPWVQLSERRKGCPAAGLREWIKSRTISADNNSPEAA